MTDIACSAAAEAASSASASDSAGVAVRNAASIQQKYSEERDKRLRAEGSSQFINLITSEKFKHFQEDPWVDHETLNAQELPLRDGGRYKFLILGAGYGGLLFAVRLIEAGFSADDIRIVDSAGGFGGTWYYNRYPGLQCDVESYIYMPLLEETGHIPEYKYAKGSELREYANEIAERWNLDSKAAFRIEVASMKWDEKESEWKVDMRQNRGPEQQTIQLHIQAQFVITASGLLNYPQIPDITGIGDFKGHIFHTSRWDYKYTGGTQQNPILTGLEGKKVGIIGTGATSVQIIPQLAKFAQELYVFQRTPSAVDERGNHKTDPEWFRREVAYGKGWQRERTQNFQAFLSNVSPPPVVNLVQDAWTYMPSFSALLGSDTGVITPDKVPAHLATLHALDLVRSERVRARVDEIVKDKATAEKLKAWYPGWCKRPTFHDEYLPAFNKPNVTLVDTNGKGVDSISEHGLVVQGKEYEVDVLVLGTGYYSPAKSISPASRANMTIIGRDGKCLEQEWAENGMSTLHGHTSRGFPNLFWPGTSQAAASANHMFTLDQAATHVAYLISEAGKKVGQGKYTIEPSAQAQDDWAMQTMSRAAAFAGVRGCTPSYLNREGEADKPKSPAEQMKAAKGAPWGEGMNSYLRVVESWRAEGNMQGMEISAC